MKIRSTALALALGILAAASVCAQPGPVKIGFITDMSGVYADLDGKNGTVAVQMAIADFGGKVLGHPIELITADHQDKADTAASKARQWIDSDGVTLLINGTNSAAALAIAKVAEEKKRVYFITGAAATELTNEQCTPYTVHFGFDTAMLGNGTAGAMAARGDKSWFFLTADYTFGHSLEANATRAIEGKGGTVAGHAMVPLNASDFSSYMVQAQASKAQVLGLANGGGDFQNAVKAANEFGLTKTMKIAGLLVNLSDIHSLGLKITQGLLQTTTWDWNLNDRTRAFAKRFYEKTKLYPTAFQADDYATTLTYLNAVKAAGTTDADPVMAKLKSMPIDYWGLSTGHVRSDGRFVHDVYLMQVKTPAESKGPWDLLKVVAKLDGNEVFTTQAESRCKLWK